MHLRALAGFHCTQPRKLPRIFLFAQSSGLFDLRIVCDETGERAFSIQVLLVFQADMIISGRMLNVNFLIREEIELF